MDAGHRSVLTQGIAEVIAATLIVLSALGLIAIQPPLLRRFPQLERFSYPKPAKGTQWGEIYTKRRDTRSKEQKKLDKLRQSSDIADLVRADALECRLERERGNPASFTREHTVRTEWPGGWAEGYANTLEEALGFAKRQAESQHAPSGLTYIDATTGKRVESPFDVENEEWFKRESAAYGEPPTPPQPNSL